MDPDTDGPPRGLLIAAIVVAVGAIGGVLAAAVLRQAAPHDGPVAVPAAPASAADSGPCRVLLTALPDQLDDYRRATIAQPSPPGAAAWRANPTEEPVVLRCGVDRPAEFVNGTPVQVVNGVQWFQVGEDSVGDVGADEQQRSTWFVVDRSVYIALTLPRGSGPTPIQQLSDVIRASLPAQPVAPAR